jgi:aminoglycoside phosphotransferase (APT) family kinase protein
MDGVTAEWLDSVLRCPDDRTEVVRDLRVHRWRGKPVSLLLKLIPTYAPSAPSRLPRSFVLKLAKPGPPSAAAERRRAKEHVFYTAVAPAMANPPLVRVWSADHDPASGATHLLMDDLEPTHSRPLRGLPPTGAQATATVDALAAIHAAWWGQPDALQVVTLRDAVWIDARTRSASRAVDGLLAQVGHHLAPGMRRALAEAKSAYDGLRRAPARGPATLVHGDAHAWNCLTPTNGGAPVLLDWEAWTVDSGAYDLASLIALRFDPETRRLLEPGLLRRYHDRLLALGLEGYGWDALRADYRDAVLRRALVPALQWRRGVPVATWWNNLSRISLALSDLDHDR